MNKNLKLINELMETGEEFDVISGRFSPYHFKDGLLIDSQDSESCMWFNELTVENIIRKPWEPKIGEKYYFASPYVVRGVEDGVWTANILDTCIKRNLKICRTKQQAVEDARQRGWID